MEQCSSAAALEQVTRLQFRCQVTGPSQAARATVSCMKSLSTTSRGPTGDVSVLRDPPPPPQKSPRHDVPSRYLWYLQPRYTLVARSHFTTVKLPGT